MAKERDCEVLPQNIILHWYEGYPNPHRNKHCVGERLSFCLYVGRIFVLLRAPSCCACMMKGAHVLSENTGLQCSCVCSGGKSWLNIDETATVKRSVWFWEVSPGLMAECHSDFHCVFVCMRVCYISLSVSGSSSQCELDPTQTAASRSLGNPKAVFVISPLINNTSSSLSAWDDKHGQTHSGDGCTALCSIQFSFIFTAPCVHYPKILGT